MRFRFELLALVPLLLFSTACEPPPADEALTPENRAALEVVEEDPEVAALTAEDRRAIEALAEGYTERALAGDWERWADLYHPEAVRLYPGTEDWEGREEIREMVEASPPSLDVLEITTVEVEGNRELAYSRGTFRVDLTMQEDGEEVRVRDEGSWLFVVKRDEDDAWRIYRHVHNSNLPQAPAPGGEE